MNDFTIEELELIYVLVTNLYGKSPSKHIRVLLDKIERNIDELERRRK